MSNFKNSFRGNIWLCSDLHLGHGNIASKNTSQWKSGYRPFDSIEHMDHVIIDNINRYIKQNDIIIFHGDFSFGGHTKIPDYRRRIICENFHFIRGNHDQHIDKYKDYFSSIQDYWEGTLNGHPWVAMHYAMRIWLGSHKGFCHTYGHSHSSLETNSRGETTPWGKSMDVGIDNAYRLLGEYRPFSLDEVVDIFSLREAKIIDNHGSGTNVR
jgi:calcineurin-like phosphoesterase family protein